MTTLDALLTLFYKVFYFILLRESAQIQLVTILVVLVIAWFGSKKLLQILDRFLPQVLVDKPHPATVIEQEYDKEDVAEDAPVIAPPAEEPPRRSVGQQLVHFTRIMAPELVLPVVIICLIALAQALFAAQGYLVGLLVQFNWFLIVFLGYRVVVGLLHYLLSDEYAVPYHYQLLLPVLVLYVAFQTISWFIDPQILGEIVVFDKAMWV